MPQLKSIVVAGMLSAVAVAYVSCARGPEAPAGNSEGIAVITKAGAVERMLERLAALRILDRNFDLLKLRRLLRVLADVRFDRSGANDVYADFVARQFKRRHLREGYLPGFRCAVSGRPEARELAASVNRARTDDAAAVLLHMWTCVFDCQERSFQVRCKRMVPIVLGHVLDRRPRSVNARSGEHDIESVPLLKRLPNSVAHAFRVRNVDVRYDRLSAGLLD